MWGGNSLTVPEAPNETHTMRSLHVLGLCAAIGTSGAACGGDNGGTGPSNTDPVAEFTFECNQLACSFLDGSSDPDAGDEVAGWLWSFGDNSGTVIAPDPDHTYPAPGTYHVTLTVTDQNGAEGSVTKAVTVSTVSQPT
jgi:PKD repeat protein